jgi:hypothetical protein
MSALRSYVKTTPRPRRHSPLFAKQRVRHQPLAKIQCCSTPQTGGRRLAIEKGMLAAWCPFSLFEKRARVGSWAGVTQHRPAEITREESGARPLNALSRVTWGRAAANWWRNSGLLADTLASVARETKVRRLGGCAGSPKPTHLSLQLRKCRVISPNCRDSAVILLERLRHLNAWHSRLPNSGSRENLKHSSEVPDMKPQVRMSALPSRADIFSVEMPLSDSAGH